VESFVEENVVRRLTFGILLVLAVALAACGGGQADITSEGGESAETAAAEATPSVDRTPRARLSEDFEMPLSMRLPVGTLMLEQTDYAVTPAQAEALMPLWQMLRALQESGTATQIEVEAVFDQIQEAMTAEQLAAIEEMNPEDMQDLLQGYGMRRQGDTESGEGGGFRPPEGMMTPGGGEGRQGMGPGGFADLSSEEQATMMAGRGGMGMGFGGTAFTEQVIELLEARAAES
jgi:hypothetical protein